MAMKAGDVMTTGAATIPPDASLAEAARIMIENRLSGLPVVDADGKLIGVVTEHDFLRRESGHRPRWLDVLLTNSAEEITARALRDRRVEEVMSKNPVFVGADTPIEVVFQLMEGKGVKRVPVVRKGKVIGIVSRADLLRAVMRKANHASGPRG
jgi:CBS domain-containing protein